MMPANTSCTFVIGTKHVCHIPVVSQSQPQTINVIEEEPELVSKEKSTQEQKKPIPFEDEDKDARTVATELTSGSDEDYNEVVKKTMENTTQQFFPYCVKAE
eukprot:4326698-Ditylum_brightwellii.AAC.2